MYGPKFTPYNKMNDVYQEEYEEEDSEPLIQQVDPDYEPTEREVRQYAIQVLGMNLPEDQRLIYLAREGLKAPLPTNWQPIQGRDGQVYYKHKITQEKTYDHPTDVEYQKKYIQEKERSARKNLKSMSLKSNPLSGFGQPLGQAGISNLGQKPAINPLGLSNLSAQSYHTISKEVSKLDPRLEQQLSREVDELEQKLRKQLKQFQTQRRQLHEKNMKNYKADFQTSLNEFNSDKTSSSSYEKTLKLQKQSIKSRLHQAYQDRFKEQFTEVQKQQEKKFNSLVQVLEQDNKIKLKKYEAQKQNQFSDKLRKIQMDQKKHQQAKRQNQQQRQKTISHIRSKLQQEDNQQILDATRDTFENQIQLIKQKNSNKIKEVQQKLTQQFSQMNKMLGNDPSQLFQQLAQKKNRLKKISQQKIQSLKKRQYQKVSQSHNQQLQKSIKQIEVLLQTQHIKQLQQHKLSTQSKFQSMKHQLDLLKNQNLTKKVQNMYTELKRSSNLYEKDKNKKILQIRQKFISEIVSKNNTKSSEIDTRLKLKDKEQMLQNKEQLVQSLKRQVELERFVLKDLKMNKNIVSSTDIDGELKKLMTQLGINYKPQVFLKHQKLFNQIKKKYKSDKQLLGSMMNQLQSTSFMPFYDKHTRGVDCQKSSTTSILVKQYNQDVRIMRKNEEMLSKYELLLRKAELNDQNSLKQLEGLQFQYEDISLRSNLGMTSFDNEPRINQIPTDQHGVEQRKTFYGTSHSYQTVEQTLQQHSKFLSNVKAQLNRKLYKVRSNNLYRV